MSLTTLPFDILLGIFREIEPRDVVRVGTTCKDLYWHTQGYHVWLSQSQECLRRMPSLKRQMPTLTSLMTEELKAFAVRQAKLHLRWDRRPGWKSVFALAGSIEERSFDTSLWLLPGGEDVLLMSDSGEINLCRVTLSNAGASSKQLARTTLEDVPFVLKLLFYETTPHPILAVQDLALSVHLFSINQEDGSIDVGPAFDGIREDHLVMRGHGNNRMIGFVVDGNDTDAIVAVTNLDYPGVTVEVNCLNLYTTETGNLWDICFPTPDLLVCYCAEHIVAWKLPSFLDLSKGRHLLNNQPAWHLPLCLERPWGSPMNYTHSRPFYNPTIPDEFTLGFFYEACPVAVVTAVTVNPPSLEMPSDPGRLRMTTGRYRNSIVGSGGREYLRTVVKRWNDRLEIWVTPLEHVAQVGGRGRLWMSVSMAELQMDPVRLGVAVDEVTGRVVLWGWDKRMLVTKIYVADLV